MENELETVAERFERDVANQPFDRYDRNFGHQPDDRLHRRYVISATGDSEFETFEHPDAPEGE